MSGSPQMKPGKRERNPPRPYYANTGGFDRHAKAIGMLIHDWNALQNAYMRLFISVVASPFDDITKAVWHSAKTDTGQRDMLKAALAEYLHDEPIMFDEIQWYLNKTNTISAVRNDAVHVEISVAPYRDKRRKPSVIIEGPPTKEKRLKGKELIKLFSAASLFLREMCECVETLHEIILGPNESTPIIEALLNTKIAEPAWPRRPKPLRVLHDYLPPESNRKRRRKAQRHLRKPSRG